MNGGSSVGMSSTEQGDSFDFYTQSVATDDAFYFFFSNRTQLGNLVDTSRVPGGYGVYRLPYGWVDTDEPYKGQADGWHNYDVFADQLECIYAVGPEITLSYLAGSGDGNCSVSMSGRLARMTGGSGRTGRISSSSASRTNSSSTR